MIACRGILGVFRELVGYLSALLWTERRARGIRTGSRALTCWNQALFVLAWFCTHEDLRVFGAGVGISRATASRYRDEGLVVLAEQALDLHEALDRGATEGWSHVICDGTLVATDWCQAKTTSRKGKTIDVWYSGKTGDFGGNIQAEMRPAGLPIWVSDVEPGSTRDLTAARAHVLGALYAAAARGLPTLADPGYVRGRPRRVDPGQAARQQDPARP